jgi:hypothetical protein
MASDAGADVLVPEAVSPLYEAVNACERVGRIPLLIVAAPLMSGTVPSGWPSAENDTVPVGGGVPGTASATVAVRTTLSPYAMDDFDSASVVIVGASTG